MAHVRNSPYQRNRRRQRVLDRLVPQLQKLLNSGLHQVPIGKLQLAALLQARIAGDKTATVETVKQRVVQMDKPEDGKAYRPLRQRLLDLINAGLPEDQQLQVVTASR